MFPDLKLFLKLISVILFALLLTNCSYIYGEQGIIKNRDTDYLKAKSIPPLQIPPGLSSSTIHAHFPVSDRHYSESEKIITLVPPNLNGPGAI